MYTLQELKDLKQEWINQAEMGGTFHDCKLIAERLGEELELPYPHSETQSALLYVSEHVFFTLVGNTGRWLKHVKDFHFTNTLYVTVYGPRIGTDKGLLVARRTWSNNPSFKSDSLFIPGDWEEVIPEPAKRATNTVMEEEMTLEEIERQKLLKELLIEEEV